MASTPCIVKIYGPHEKPPDGIRANVTSKAAARGPNEYDDSVAVPFSALSPFNIGPVSVYAGIVRREARVMEGGWQYSKVYKARTDSAGNPTINHVRWAKAGFEARAACRFPMGRGAKPEFSLWRGEKLSYQPARLLIYIPMYVEAIVRTPAARTAFVKLQILRRKAAKEEKSVVLFDYDGYDHHKKGLTFADVICADRKMGHAFVLAMMLEDKLISSIQEAASRLMPEKVLEPYDLPPDFAPLRKDELLKTLSVGGSRIHLRERFLNRMADRLLAALLPGGATNVPWETRTIMMYGRECKEGRMTAHHGDAGTSYKYSGKEHTPLPWSADLTGVLSECIFLVWLATGQKCNYCLLNYYEDGYQKLNMHSDSESDLVTGSYICSISVGAERDLAFEPKTQSKGFQPPSKTTCLPHGSLLVMGGLCQKTYKHGSPKTARSAPRASTSRSER